MSERQLQYETDKKIIISNRVSKDFQGNKLYGCDVCWTCKWFDVELKACRPVTSFKDCIIKNPEVYRCSFWSEIWYDE
jgi:hypothetical protein